MSSRVVEKAHAKLNLNLHITARRVDGYHLLDSLVVFTDLADTLRAEPTEESQIHLIMNGPFAAGLSDKDNLVVRAAELLRTHAHGTQGAILHLTKMIPHGAGLGGGSADAAAALRALNKLWALDLGQAELEMLAAQLGADVAACITEKPVRMQGIGEVLSPIAPFPNHAYVLIVFPNEPCSTVAVYQALKPPYLGELPYIPHNTATWGVALRNLRNELQAPATELCPVIGSLIHALASTPDVICSGMTGSGSACFAIFEKEEAARRAKTHLTASHSTYFFHVGKVI